MKGFVETPRNIVDQLVEKLFAKHPPERSSRVLDPGCGRGAFIEGVIQWCSAHRHPSPRILGIESDVEHARFAERRFARHRSVTIVHGDFLEDGQGEMDYVIGNPPYVSLVALSAQERARYRDRYLAAQNRFDLSALFFEEALRRLAVGGRLVFVTPEKYLYVESAAPLRRLLAQRHVAELHFLPEDSFPGLVTYPLITTVDEGKRKPTSIMLRSGVALSATLSGSGVSWLSGMATTPTSDSRYTLADACERISCGIATGADGVFLVESIELPKSLARFAHATISGRQLRAGQPIEPTQSLLVPYDHNGKLLPEDALGDLAEYLRLPPNEDRLIARVCARQKPWYAYHETPHLSQILRPKLLFKDITREPQFFVDWEGSILPRHSVYYAVPKSGELLGPLADFLNSEVARDWLRQNCQRAANGFVRLQSHVLKRMPIPESLVAKSALNHSLDVAASSS